MADALDNSRIPVPESLLAKVLAPYKRHCRYLGAAEVSLDDADSLCSVSGSFAIPESCYIDDTGHLNAVEVNICYNQMLYTLYAMGVEHGFIPPLAELSLDAWLERQLPDVLIHKIDMTFKRPINPRRFSGSMRFLEVSERKGYLLFPSRCEFHDDDGGLAIGRVSVVIDNRGVGRRTGDAASDATQHGGA